MSSIQKIPAPALLAALSFFVICLGTALLLLPGASVESITISEAFFTATSAVTVTGLTVVDTGSTYTLFGQTIIALMIQMGGMGLMTFAIFVLATLGAQIGFSRREILREEIGVSNFGNLFKIMKTIFKLLLIIELIGAVILSFVFVPEFGWAEGIWQSVFHSISATNNAGFSLFPDSISRYADNSTIVLVMSAQFVLAGLGFAVISDVLVLKKWEKFSLHARLMLWGTLLIVLISYSLYGVFEWTNPSTLGGFDTTATKLRTIWFEVVTPRTAGFNIVDTSAIHDKTAILIMVLMLIGGGSTSTAGGIKVTGFLIFILWCVSALRRSKKVYLFGFCIDHSQGVKALILVLTILLLASFGTAAIMMTHQIPLLSAAFEVVSALGTVGLSQGVTSELNNFGRCVLCLMMFFGRMGPLALGFYLSTLDQEKTPYPKGHVYFG